MNTRRMLAGAAIALTAFLSAAAPAMAGEDYPINRPDNQEVAEQGATGPTGVAGVKTGSGQVASDTSGLADTGADLAPLWGGLGLLLAGGVLLTVSRRRQPTN